jgi:LysR family transcriptional regulator, low CO2-responsive transcriptional regulator
MINAEWLGAFVKFAETMNFTHAAQALHISQPALHVQIRKLSESLGVPLYVRRGRTLELTVQGRHVLAFGREQQERADQFLAELDPGARDTSVVLAAGEGTLLNLLSDALRAFQRVKHVKLHVLTRDRDQAIAAVQVGEAHLAVTVVDDVPANLVARKVAAVGAAVVLRASHRLARKRSLSIRDLRDEPLIVPSPGRPLRATLARAWANADLTWSPAVEANGWELMMRFVELGLGLAIVNDFCKPPRSTVMRSLVGLPPVQYQLLKLRDRRSSQGALALERAILDR